jgi:phosphoribosyl-dephospho-CoA transferase
MKTDAIVSTFDAPPHTLLRIAGAGVLRAAGEAPGWIQESLSRAPWVVVRRARRGGGCLPVGVRGDTRAARFGAYVDARDIQEAVTPQDIAAARLWSRTSRRDELPAMAVLPAVEAILLAHGLGDAWGPTGSVGFELVSGHPAAHRDSDLDIAVRMRVAPSATEARALVAVLALLPVRIDVLVETPPGALALAECAGSQDRRVLRTADGPRVVSAITG